MKNIVRVINSVQASGADCVVDTNGNIFVTGFPGSFRTSQVKAFSVQPYVADQLAIWTGTPTAANLTGYAIKITGISTVTKQPKDWVMPAYTSDASGTATEICDAVRTWVASLRDFPGVGSGTTTAIITAAANYPAFSVTNIGAGTIAWVNGTTQINGHGGGARLIAVGDYIPPAAETQLVSTNNYSTIQMEIYNDTMTGFGTPGTSTNVVLYVNEGDTDYVTLIGYDSTSGAAYGTLSAPLYNNKRAVYTTATADATVANGVLTLQTDVFYGNTDTNIALSANDFILIALVDYRLISILTGATAATSSIPNDGTGATLYVKLPALPS